MLFWCLPTWSHVDKYIYTAERGLMNYLSLNTFTPQDFLSKGVMLHPNSLQALPWCV